MAFSRNILVSVVISYFAVASAFSNLPFALRSVSSQSRLAPLASEVARGPDEYPRRHKEFSELEPLPQNEIRRRRMEIDNEKRSQFVTFGDELWDLRSEMERLSSYLVDAMTQGKESEERKTRSKLREVEQKDPELVYMLEKVACRDALAENRMEDAALHQERATVARSCLPQFNLEGLWVGKYGAHGYELINVTYVDDTLIAEKITGDRNVPRGELTFKVDLDPLKIFKTPAGGTQHKSGKGFDFSGEQAKLDPIKLTDKAARRWGTSQLPRYSGLGQVAEEGFKNSQMMDGQLIIIGQEYFSFAWLPIEQQIFFGRPSPELILKMLRESGIGPLRSRSFDEPPSLNDDVDILKSFAARCMEVTQEYEDDLSIMDSPTLSCIWHDSSEECYFE
ncbi:hypothetical protein FisN_1Lh588 [Fistulifera solaris]|uniref:Uncharacterized protein n=1 Tax=Fistulifera solaris TaxID=1519565 RepID=A0A1Z5K1P8_FISSO|nr:hypothetical protein FisN_1Lh588 [Fistulifera solaris]|eukprot:GAX19941.1 hypothetical protein FisN_1Lh588 [Fistulifera solaris]